MILIFELLYLIFLLLTGMCAYSLIWGVVIGLIVEFIIKSGDYRSAKRAVFGYALLMLTSCANYIHWLNASAEWLNKNAATYGQDFMYTISGWLDYWWMFPAVILSAFIGGILGGLLGRAVLKKHFLRSGLVWWTRYYEIQGRQQSRCILTHVQRSCFAWRFPVSWCQVILSE